MNLTAVEARNEILELLESLQDIRKNSVFDSFAISAIEKGLTVGLNLQIRRLQIRVEHTSYVTLKNQNLLTLGAEHFKGLAVTTLLPCLVLRGGQQTETVFFLNRKHLDELISIVSTFYDVAHEKAKAWEKAGAENYERYLNSEVIK
jgi:hypothetical protein